MQLIRLSSVESNAWRSTDLWQRESTRIDTRKKAKDLQASTGEEVRVIASTGVILDTVTRTTAADKPRTYSPDSVGSFRQ
jgi:hypothetical protein